MIEIRKRSAVPGPSSTWLHRFFRFRCPLPRHHIVAVRVDPPLPCRLPSAAFPNGLALSWLHLPLTLAAALLVFLLVRAVLAKPAANADLEKSSKPSSSSSWFSLNLGLGFISWETLPTTIAESLPITLHPPPAPAMRGRHVYRGGRGVGFFHPSTSNTRTQRAMVEASHASIGYRLSGDGATAQARRVSAGVMRGASGAGGCRVIVVLPSPSWASLLAAAVVEWTASATSSPCPAIARAGFRCDSVYYRIPPVPGPSFSFLSHVPIHPVPVYPLPHPIWTSRFLASVVAYRLCATPGPHCTAQYARPHPASRRRVPDGTRRGDERRWGAIHPDVHLPLPSTLRCLPSA
ncbi:hypothetical protein B0H14DRAFT_3444717 [Mycena olivaceomarginata]|nr:hypothetical protein B0H14DRAFT_3444717 [Mycena olivaceomarginata]